MALTGKVGIVFGVANAKSLAWAVARAWSGAGARVGVAVQDERFIGRLHKAARLPAAQGGWPVAGEVPPVAVCDATDSDQLKDAVEQLVGALEAEAAAARMVDPAGGAGAVVDTSGTGGACVDMVLHSIAHAPASAMKPGPTQSVGLLSVSMHDFLAAHAASAYSLVAIARAVQPHLRLPGGADGGSGGGDDEGDARSCGPSITALTYLGSTRVVPSYGVMGPAKASLEACARHLAAELGPSGVRVNCISAGPVSTLAARGIPGFPDLAAAAAAASPLQRGIDADDVGALATFLASDAARSVTGQTMFVDGGYSIMGAPHSA